MVNEVQDGICGLTNVGDLKKKKLELPGFIGAC